MTDSWIKLFRKFREWEWYDDSNTKSVWLEILLTANFEDKSWHGIVVKRGQLITSTSHLSKNLDISTQSIRTCLNKLKSTNELTIKTTAHYTLITVNKYNSYQESTNQLTNNQQTTNKQLTTTKEAKNVKNVRTMQESSQGDAQVEKLLSERTGVAYEYQDAGLSVWQELKAPEDKKPEFIRVFKNERGVAESAFRFAADYPDARLKWKMFFWKYNQLLKVKKANEINIGQSN